MAATTTQAIGPVDTEISASLGWRGPASDIHVAPLGAVEVASHRGPLRLTARVVQILTHLGVPFQTANVLEDAELRDGIKQFSNWPTIPQLYVKGEFVGGCDIVTEMYQSGELSSMLAEKGIPHEANA